MSPITVTQVQSDSESAYRGTYKLSTNKVLTLTSGVEPIPLWCMNQLLTIETNLCWPYDTILLFSFMRSFTEDLDGCMSSMLLNRGYSDAISLSHRRI